MNCNKNQPLVSICIPVYNHENYVIESIKSIIQQTYKKIELIIIDDGSSDSSRNKVESIIDLCEKRFERFEFRSRPNKGLSTTLNEALDWCRGEYFSVLASDDIMSPEKTQKQIEVLLDEKYAKENIAIVSHDIQPIREDGLKVSHKKSEFKSGSVFGFRDVYLSAAKIMAPAVMVLTDVIREVGGYKNGLAIEDLYMWLSITKKGYRVLYIDEVVTEYRLHKDNTASKAKLMHRAHDEIFKEFSPSVPDLEIALERSARIAFQGAVTSDKNYAVELIKTKQINPLKLCLIPYTLRLFVPVYFIKLLKSFLKSKL